MEAKSPTKSPMKRSNTKTKLVYGRRRSFTDKEIDNILQKDPKDMTEEEKVRWKVEVMHMCEDTDDLIQEKLKKVAQEREEIRNLIAESKHTI